MALPDFLLIGAPKAGTTALPVALAQHPQVFLSRVKEPKFFLVGETPPPSRGGPGDARTYGEYVWRRTDYEALFDAAPPGALRGESTTLYLREPAAHERIAALLPSARLVAVVRDPVDRAHSNWTHLRSAGLEPEPDFVRACALEARRAGSGGVRSGGTSTWGGTGGSWRTSTPSSRGSRCTWCSTGTCASTRRRRWTGSAPSSAWTPAWCATCRRRT